MPSCQDTIRSYEPFNFEDPKLPKPETGDDHEKTIEIHGEMIYVGCGPLPVTVGNEGLWESPIKNVMILVVTVTGRGPHPSYTLDSRRPNTW